MNKSIKILFVSFICSVCVFTSVETHSETIIIKAGSKGVSPDYVNALKGDTLIWRRDSNENFHIICDGSFNGTNIPEGAAIFDFYLNESSQEYSYILKIKGQYDYKCLTAISEYSCRIYAGSPLPVELTDFVATTIKNEVILDWSTSGEINNDRFEIQRIEITDMIDLDPDNLTFNTVGIVNGNGTSNAQHHYKFTDRNLNTGIYLYRLKQIDYNSNFLFHLLSDEINIGIPNKFTVKQNYPNPFNPTTLIGFELPQNGNVKIVMYNSEGRELMVLEDNELTAGYHSVTVNGSDLPSGVYYYNFIYRSNGINKSVSKKMLLIK